MFPINLIGKTNLVNQNTLQSVGQGREKSVRGVDPDDVGANDDASRGKLDPKIAGESGWGTIPLRAAGYEGNMNYGQSVYGLGGRGKKNVRAGKVQVRGTGEPAMAFHQARRRRAALPPAPEVT